MTCKKKISIFFTCFSHDLDAQEFEEFLEKVRQTSFNGPTPYGELVGKNQVDLQLTDTCAQKKTGIKQHFIMKQKHHN